MMLKIAGRCLLGMLFAGLIAAPFACGQAPVAPPSAGPSPASVHPAAAARDTYCNPLDVLLADPFIYREGDTYYLYGTAARDGLLVWTSHNLVDWQLRGHAFKRSKQTWSRRYFWAPEMFRYRGKYYLHFTAVGGDTQLRRIVLAEGDSPLGPFREIKAPWFDPGRSTIDSDVFRDTDGSMYLYSVYTGSKDDRKFELMVRRLNDQLVPEAKATLCMTPELPWEGGMVNEGPFVMKHGDTYLLTYSSNGFQDPNYQIGVATSKSPLGPWIKRADGPILHRTKTVSGPGHHCFIDSPDHKELFIAYHTHQFLRAPGGPRQLAIDRAEIVDDGHGVPTIRVHGPTDTPQPMPSGAAPLVRGQSDEFNEPALLRDRWDVFSEDGSKWKLADGHLIINTSDGDVFEDRSDLSNLFLTYAPFGDFDVTTRCTLKPDRDFEQAFLSLWQDHQDYAKIAYVHTHGARKLEVGVEKAGDYTSHLHDVALGDEVYLRIRRRGNATEFLSSGDGRTWRSIEKQDVPLTDLRVGLGACSPDSPRSIPVAFDYLRFSNN
jgi:beta-xylosidase